MPSTSSIAKHRGHKDTINIEYRIEKENQDSPLAINTEYHIGMIKKDKLLAITFTRASDSMLSIKLRLINMVCSTSWLYMTAYSYHFRFICAYMYLVYMCACICARALPYKISIEKNISAMLEKPCTYTRTSHKRTILCLLETTLLIRPILLNSFIANENRKKSYVGETLIAR